MSALAAALCLACALAVAAVAAAATGAGQGAGPGAERLPDLEQETPSGLEITVAGTHKQPAYRLGFRSAVRNVGDGPLVIDGHRDASSPAMVADQLVDREGAEPAVVADVGRLSYVRSPDHQHWHLHKFDRYELRSADGRTVVRDRKSGFCLGDRFRMAKAPAAAQAQPRFRTNCGLVQPGLLQVQEGISVGYGDDYAANLEYQDLPLGGLRSGRYVLVHRVNSDRRLRETRYDNDAASLLLELRWTGGEPSIRVLATCPGTDRCAARSAPAPAPAAAPNSGAARLRAVASSTLATRSRFLCPLLADA